MKIKQLLPIALVAAMMTSAAFAEGPTPAAPTGIENHADQVLQLTVPEYINIWVKSSNPTEAVTPNETYTSFSIAKALNVDYGVLTNKTGDKIYLKATTGASLKALKATAANDLRVAFVNTEATLGTPDQDAVDSALGKLSDRSKDANVIALDFTRVITPSAGGTTVTEDVSAGTSVAYTLQAGTYDFNYTSLLSDANSLSTHDEYGAYKATLTLTHAAP